MAIYTTLPAEIREVDVIIAGGGSAGCIIAARLSDADPRLSILLIEGGASNHDIPELAHPAMLMSNLAPGNRHNLYYKAKASPDLAGRELVIPTGGVLGGGSSVNLMVYTRPQRSDFEAWSIPGWDADEMLRYMNKLETYHGPNSEARHGRDGPIHVSGSRLPSSRLEDDFIAAVSATGWSECQDLQTMDTTIGVQRAMRYVDLEGRRQDTAHQYLFPRLHDGRHPNLHVLVESPVKRVLFDDKRAVGVEYQARQTSFGDQHVTRMSVKAKKMVIISCGALGSPLLLEYSGIGNPGILRSANVPIVSDIPDVGSHYQDHHMMTYSYKSCLEPNETIDAISSGRLALQDLVDRKEPILAWNSIDAYCKLRPDEADVASLGPAFEREWSEKYQQQSDRPLMLVSLAGGFPGDPTSVPEGQYFCIATFSGYPISRGEIHITGADSTATPEFTTGFFSDPNDIDLKKHVWMYKKQRMMARRMGVFRGELPTTHPEFPASSAAACTDGPVLGPAPEIQYTSKDDEAIESWLRGNVNTTWHGLGTCRMSQACDQGGVVDANLSVYGVEGLKVADLSILPGNVGCNTNSVAMAVGEKAADIFIRELGLVT
ncbi:putative alcohol oxidase [Rosellinia necatrix]|uniref:Putative alcohol oxidase n=1 Tax=Rosellinia necatrix TaxID=77044 RepID=A0A1W2TKA0_ROSNE|nr:putative alcohol oxidase [Rosellinia necatrix]